MPSKYELENHGSELFGELGEKFAMAKLVLDELVTVRVKADETVKSYSPLNDTVYKIAILKTTEEKKDVGGKEVSWIMGRYKIDCVSLHSLDETLKNYSGKNDGCRQ